MPNSPHPAHRSRENFSVPTRWIGSSSGASVVNCTKDVRRWTGSALAVKFMSDSRLGIAESVAWVGVPERHLMGPAAGSPERVRLFTVMSGHGNCETVGIMN